MRTQSKDGRPVNLDLGTIKFPITALGSITHRVSGVILFFSSFVLLWALDVSLASEAGFEAITSATDGFLGKTIAWSISTSLTYHALAGIKHLIMDLGIGETMRGGKIGATLVFMISASLSVLWLIILW